MIIICLCATPQKIMERLPERREISPKVPNIKCENYAYFYFGEHITNLSSNPNSKYLFERLEQKYF